MVSKSSPYDPNPMDQSPQEAPLIFMHCASSLNHCQKKSITFQKSVSQINSSDKKM